MTPILFYGVPEGRSSGSIVALEWSGATYRLCRIEMPALVTSDSYKPINPIQRNPVTDAAGRKRPQRKHGDPIPHCLAHGLDRMGFRTESRDVRPAEPDAGLPQHRILQCLLPALISLEHEMTPKQQEALRDYGIAKVQKAHAKLEALLGDNTWLLGNEKSFADAYFAGIARWRTSHEVVDRADFPRLNALYDRLQEEPAVRFAKAIEHEEEANTTGKFLGHITLDEALETLRQAA